MNSFLHSHPSPSPRQRRRGIAVAVFVGLVFIPMGLKAQIPELTSPDVLPESPAAAQIAKYIDCPVDLGNGLVQIEIPLFVIVDGDIRIPLTLSYHASGLKPNMRSSCWLGDGWSLSTGPSLSRSIAGGADEWFYNSTIAEAESPTWYQLSQVVSQAADATLDEYHYALLSGSGRMYIRNPDRTTRKAVTIPDDPVLVEFPSSQDWSSTIVMTDRTGLLYTFGGEGNCSDRIPHTFGGSYHEVRTSWKVREIRSATTGRSVRFSYTSPTEEIVCSRWADAVVMLDRFAGQIEKTIPAVMATGGAGPQDTHYYRYNSSAGALALAQPEEINLPTGYSFPQATRQDIVQYNCYPQRIDFSEGHVEFVRNSGSTSAYGPKAGSFLSELLIYDLFGTLVRKVTFNQSCSPEDFTLRLNSVTICGPDGADAMTWSFSYNGNPLPRDTRALDLWGYYNGHEENTTLVPTITTDTVVHSFPLAADQTVSVTIPGGNRTTEETAMKRGMLSAVIYPTGGRTEFEYEAHRYLDGNGQTRLAGGLRIKQIRDIESDGVILFRNFCYSTEENYVNSAGLLNVIPTGGTSSIYYPKDSLMYSETVCNEFSGSPGSIVATYKERVWSDNSLVGLTGDSGSSVSYPYVIETRTSGTGSGEGSSGDNTIGRTVHHFNIVQSYPLRVGVSHLVSDSREGWKSGRNTGEKVFRKDGSLALQSSLGYTNEYDTGDNTTRIRQVQASRTARVYGTDESLVAEEYRAIAHIATNLSQGRSLPASKSQTIHETNGSLTTTSDYTYDSYGNIKTETLGGLGIPGNTSRVTVYEYAYEKDGTTYSEMTAGNMVGIPVETRTYRNSANPADLLTTQATAFGKYPRGASSSAGFFFAPSSRSLTVKGNPGTERMITINAYDYRGNILEATGLDGQKTVWLWGYGGTHPVARVQGSSWSGIKAYADTSALNTGQASAIASKLSSFRNRFTANAGVHVTTMTWKPLSGVASMTGPSGRTESFSYDALGRLVSSSFEGCTTASYTYSYGAEDGGNRVMATKYLSQDGTQSNDTYTFYDRLGRPVETLLAAASSVNGTQQDIITFTAYDDFGRESVQYAPTPVAVSSSRPAGTFANKDQVAVQSFMFHDWDVYAYSEKTYEESPMGRMTEECGPGSPWHTRGKSTTTEHLVNEYTGVLSCGRYAITTDVSITRLDQYEAGTLNVTRTTDEDRNKTIEFTDKLGRRILTRRFDGPTILDTYYIYDDLGLLRYVLTPEASAAMSANKTYNDSASPLSTQAYIYKYDAKGRCISKKFPGTEAVLIRYDKADRQVFTQDGIQRSEGIWLYSVRDFLGREAVRGIWKAASVPDLSGTVAMATFSGTSAAGTTGGYSVNLSIPSGSSLMSASYYDDHSFTGSLPSGTASHLAADSRSGYGVPDSGSGRLKGLLTGSKEVSLDNPESESVTSFHYDALGRMTQSHTAEVLGGWRDVHLLNSFTGKTLKSLKTVTLPSGSSNWLETVYSYDSRERLSSEVATLDGEATQTLDYSYDGIGRLESKAFSDGGNGDGDILETYSYNVRGWLTGQDSDYFSSVLRYHETALGTTGLYSGNIAEWEWSRGAGTPANAWSLSYDGASRLKDAVRFTGALDSSGNMTTSTGTAVNSFSERSIAYDRNGNITSLTRYGQSATAAEDVLAYSYNGNQIVSVKNSGTLGGGGSFSYDANGNLTHDGLAGLDLGYNMLNLTERITSGDTTLAEYTYLSDGTRLCAQRGDGSGVQYRGSLIYSKATDGTLTLDCALTTGGAIVRQDGGESASGGTYQVRHYLRDHLGSVRTVVDGSTGDILETNDFLPFGKRWDLTGGSSTQTLTDPGNRWRFSGKEDQSFFNPAIPYYDFGARLHDPRTARWLCPDPLAEQKPYISQMVFCSSNPINNVDIEGTWDIKISAHQDRNNNPYARLTAYTNKGEAFFSTVVKVRGGHRNRQITNSDTPTGHYKIIEWRKTGPDTKYPTNSYGEKYLLALLYLDGEAAGMRQGMHLHVGRNRKTFLVDTKGCIRISEEDIEELYELTQWLELQDISETKGDLYVENDLDEAIEFSDRKETKESISYNGGEINPSIITVIQYSPYWGIFQYRG